MKLIDVYRDSKRVYTELYIPEGQKDSYPTVIFSHGFTATGRNQVHFAEVLNDAGFGLCLFDFCGGGFDSRSDGSSLQMSVMTEVEDLRAVYKAVADEAGVDSGNLFLMGNSQGALVSSLLALELEDQLKALVLNFPAFSIPESTRESYPEPDRIPDKTEIFDFPVGAVYHRDIWELDIFEKIGRFKKNVLIVHGSKDEIVPLSFSEKAREIYENAELLVIEGAGHGYTLSEDRILLKRTIEFINRQINIKK